MTVLGTDAPGPLSATMAQRQYMRPGKLAKAKAVQKETARIGHNSTNEKHKSQLGPMACPNSRQAEAHHWLRMFARLNLGTRTEHRHVAVAWRTPHTVSHVFPRPTQLRQCIHTKSQQAQVH